MHTLGYFRVKKLQEQDGHLFAIYLFFKASLNFKKILSHDNTRKLTIFGPLGNKPYSIPKSLCTSLICAFCLENDLCGGLRWGKVAGFNIYSNRTKKSSRFPIRKTFNERGALVITWQSSLRKQI